VVPKILDNKLFGDHYRVHLIPQFTPDWNISGTIYHDMIDIHRTNFYRQQRVYKSNHNPKCVFKNNTLLFMKNKEGLDFSNIDCFNKRLTGHHKFDYTFTENDEKKLIKDILELPYKAEMIKKHQAATVIQRAWLNHKQIHFGQRGGLYFKNSHGKKQYVQKSDKEVRIHMPQEATYMHVICVKNENLEWNYTFYIYNDKQQVIYDGFYEGKQSHEDNLLDQFGDLQPESISPHIES
jgi:hypothetical protein